MHFFEAKSTNNKTGAYTGSSFLIDFRLAGKV